MFYYRYGMMNGNRGAECRIGHLFRIPAANLRSGVFNRVEVEGFPVCHIDDIIASKEATRRAKDLESFPPLKAFREYLLRGKWAEPPVTDRLSVTMDVPPKGEGA